MWGSILDFFFVLFSVEATMGVEIGNLPCYFTSNKNSLEATWI